MEIKSLRYFLAVAREENMTKAADMLHVTQLSYNGSMFAKEGLGILLTFEHLIDCSNESGLVFRPLSPKQTSELYLIYASVFCVFYQQFTNISQ